MSGASGVFRPAGSIISRGGGTAGDAQAEAEIVARAKAGRLDAFEELVCRHHVSVYRVALRLLGNPHDAEDAVQEAFLDAWRALRSFQGRSSFSTWMYRIVTNRCFKLHRRIRSTVPLTAAHQALNDRPDRIVEAKDQLEALEQAIVALSAGQRTPLVLREFEGCSYEEIAEVLGITVAAVKGRLHRARLQLLEAMRPWA